MKTPVTSTSFFKLLLCGLAVLVTTSNAKAWWNSEWTIRKKITLDTTAAGGGIVEPIGTTAVLLRLHDGDFQFPAAKEDGSDLRFVAEDDKALLAYHIERYDPLLNEAFVWVKIPDAKPGASTTFWLYYGNSGPKAVRADDPKGSFDADTVLVYHFGEHGAPANDSSAGGNNAQNAGTPVDGSMIGGGLRFSGTNAVTIPASPALAWTDGAAMTWSAWIKPAAWQPNAVIFSRREGANAFVIGADNGVPYVEIANASGPQRTPAAAPMAINSWHQLAVVVGGGKTTLYLDGEAYGVSSAALPAMNSNLSLGGEAAGDADAIAGFNGELDELQIAKAARPAGFLKLAALGQGSEKAAKLLVLGVDEQKTGILSWLEGGTFGVIIKSLTLDGWVVICILGVMAVISWWLMVTKVGYLNALTKGNSVFMKEWKHVSTDLTVLDDEDPEKLRTLGGRIDKAGLRSMRNASVYRIYKIGSEEIRERLSADAREGRSRFFASQETAARPKVLSARSIQAIRASLDGGLIREKQKIDSLIVLLTICISGGPFLGLLGTVVGVMITFAAVAAAGEVNVNAIAPGIAAALLATVAGLAVAIPSLFGYNYILSRVKDATADMHVFIDEFVSRMAEFYSERPPVMQNHGQPQYHVPAYETV